MPYLGNNSLPFDPTRTSPAPRDADRFSGNGSTTAFTLSRSVSAAVDIEVFVENVQQEPIVAYDVNGTSLTFTGAPSSGTNNIYVVYRNFQSGAQVTMPDGSVTYSKLANNLRIFTTDNLTPNGNNAVFTLSEPPADANTVMVTVDGVVQRAPVHYTTSGSTITFTSNPPAGSNVHVRHLGFRTSTTVTQLSANSTITTPTISSPVVSGGTFDSVTRIGVGVAANTSYGIFNRYFGNSEIATQYGTGIISGVGAYASNGGVFIDNGTTKVYPMLWDTTGRVSTPNRPAFLATRTSGSVAATNDIVYNSVQTNIGSHYNSSTGVFTAPIAGMYQFNHVGISLNTGTSLTIALQVNGSSVQWMYSWGTADYRNGCFSTAIYLSANDAVKLVILNGTLYAAGDGGNPRFSGYLIG